MISKRISVKLSPDDIFVYDGQLLKTASVNLPDGISYDPNFLYLEVRAVSAGEYYGNNKNVDYFPEDQLNTKPGTPYGKETFLSAHVFKNHDNKDVANAIGDVLKVMWDDEMKGVNLLIRVDKIQNTSVARGFEHGYITDVSMGCRVHHVVCSICGHEAKTKADYCTHLKTEKGKIYPDGRKVQEINIQPKFHDISIVLNGAEKVAKVLKIYKDNSQKSEKLAALSSQDMDRIILDLGLSKTASFNDVDGMVKLANEYSSGLSHAKNQQPSPDMVHEFIAAHINSVNEQNLEKLALEQEFDKLDPGKNAFKKLATLTKLSEFEKRIEGEIIAMSAKNVENQMKEENKADVKFTEAMNVAMARNFKELGDEELDDISKKLLDISEEKRIPRFEVLRTFFTSLAVKGINLTLAEFAHLTLHVLKGMAFEGDHAAFERRIGDYRNHLTQLILQDIRNQEITPGIGLFNVGEALRNAPSPLGPNGLDKMIMAISGAAPFGRMAVVRRPMVKIASYQSGSTAPAGICGSDVSDDIVCEVDNVIESYAALTNRVRSLEKIASEVLPYVQEEQEKLAANNLYRNRPLTREDVYEIWDLGESKNPSDQKSARQTFSRNDFSNDGDYNDWKDWHHRKFTETAAQRKQRESQEAADSARRREQAARETHLNQNGPLTRRDYFRIRML